MYVMILEASPFLTLGFNKGYTILYTSPLIETKELLSD